MSQADRLRSSEFGPSAFDLPTLDKIPIIRRLLATNGTGLGLDIGVGTGYTTFSVFGSTPTICVDLHAPNLDYYVSRFRGKDAPRPLCIAADATRLPLKSGSVSFLLCSEVLEHLEDDDAAVAEIARVLAPEGRAVITTPYSGLRFSGFLELLRIKTVHDFPGPERHVRTGYDENSMSQLLSRHGLAVSEFDFYMRLFTKVLVDSLSLAHLLYQVVVKRRRSWTWAEAASTGESLPFRIYAHLFPVIRALSRLDVLVSDRRGFALVASVRHAKSAEDD